MSSPGGLLHAHSPEKKPDRQNRGEKKEKRYQGGRKVGREGRNAFTCVSAYQSFVFFQRKGKGRNIAVSSAVEG